MGIFNNKITRRYNHFIRKNFIIGKYRKNLMCDDWSLICNNCTGGFIMNDLGQQFRTPTVNLFFPKFMFFDFCEHLSYYLDNELIKFCDDTVNYPVGMIKGNNNDIPDILIHFMHYDNFECAKNVWNKRKTRVNLEKIFIMWTFAYESYPEDLYIRFEKLPYKNKIAFTNNKSFSKKYNSAFYISGFDDCDGLGLISEYSNLIGKRYYDQFDYVKWFNEG